MLQNKVHNTYLCFIEFKVGNWSEKKTLLALFCIVCQYVIGRYWYNFQYQYISTSGGSRKFWWGGDFKHKTSKIRMSSPKLRVIFRPKSEIQTFFSPKIRWSPKKKKKKKTSSPELRVIFRPDSLRLGWWGGCIPKWSRIIRNRG